MTGAKLNIVIKFDTVNGCGEKYNLILKDIQLPIDYDNIIFDFTNIGSVLGSIVDTIGNLAISFSEGIVKAGVEDVLRKEVPSLLCEAGEVSRMEAVLAAVNKDKEPVWHSLLLQGARGWGWDQLRRDFLAEKFMQKVINEGLQRAKTSAKVKLELTWQKHEIENKWHPIEGKWYPWCKWCQLPILPTNTGENVLPPSQCCKSQQPGRQWTVQREATEER